MTKRTLTIRLDADWRSGLRAAKRTYQGEVLNFETPAALFSRLTDRRWEILRTLQGQGPMALRELARRVGRDVKRVHEDVTALTDLGLVERGDTGSVVCPFETVHVDLTLRAPGIAA
jgi:predicted transcriptional regulator